MDWLLDVLEVILLREVFRALGALESLKHLNHERIWLSESLKSYHEGLEELCADKAVCLEGRGEVDDELVQ